MIENLVGLYVKDQHLYQLYREAMLPLLTSRGGGFRYDFTIDQVLKSEIGDPINRLFIIYFPDSGAKEAFFNDAQYREIRARYFEPSVLAVTLIAEYTV